MSRLDKLGHSSSLRRLFQFASVLNGGEFEPCPEHQDPRLMPAFGRGTPVTMHYPMKGLWPGTEASGPPQPPGELTRRHMPLALTDVTSGSGLDYLGSGLRSPLAAQLLPDLYACATGGYPSHPPV